MIYNAYVIVNFASDGCITIWISAKTSSSWTFFCIIIWVDSSLVPFHIIEVIELSFLLSTTNSNTIKYGLLHHWKPLYERTPITQILIFWTRKIVHLSISDVDFLKSIPRQLKEVCRISWYQLAVRIGGLVISFTSLIFWYYKHIC